MSKTSIPAHQAPGSAVGLSLLAGFALCCLFLPKEIIRGLRNLVPKGELSTCSNPSSFPQPPPRV